MSNKILKDNIKNLTINASDSANALLRVITDIERKGSSEERSNTILHEYSELTLCLKFIRQALINIKDEEDI